MGEERRTSRRSEFRLPLQWQILNEEQSLSSQIQRWHLDRVLQFQQQSASVRADFEKTMAAVRDSAVSGALRALSSRLELLESVSTSTGVRPEPIRLELSADGLGFHTRTPVNTGARLAVHIVLPDGFHLVAEATVSHCAENSSDSSPVYRVGARLESLDANSARRLTSLIIR